jgi:hypothetical protein
VDPLTKLYFNDRLLAYSLRVEVNGSGNHSSLLRHGNNYVDKKFDSTSQSNILASDAKKKVLLALTASLNDVA